MDHSSMDRSSRDATDGDAMDPRARGGLDCTKAMLALYEFLDGELTGDRRQVIEGHLDGCPHCFSVFDFEAELRIVIRTRVRKQVPSHLLARIAQTIELEAGASGPNLGPAGPTQPWGIQAGPSAPGDATEP